MTGYETFRKFAQMVAEYKESAPEFRKTGLKVLTSLEDGGQTNIMFINQYYTVSLWVTTKGVTVLRFGSGHLPQKVYWMKDIEDIEYDTEKIRIIFNGGNGLDELYIDLRDKENFVEMMDGMVG